MFEEIMESPDRDGIEKVIRKLIGETYLLQKRYLPDIRMYRDEPLYNLLQKYETQIRDYLGILGLELNHDVQFGIYYISGESVRPATLTETETRMLLVLKTIHQEKITGDGLLEPITDFRELREKGATIGLFTEKIKDADMKKSIGFFIRHNIISISDSIKDFSDSSRIYIYNTVHLMCPNNVLESVMKEYAEMDHTVAGTDNDFIVELEEDDG